MPRNPYFETAFDDNYNTWRKDVGIDITNKLSNGGRLKLLAAYNHYKRIKLKYLKDLTIFQANNLILEKYSEQLLRPELHLKVNTPRPIRKYFFCISKCIF